MTRFIKGLSLILLVYNAAADYPKRRAFRYWALVSMFPDRCLDRRARGVYQQPGSFEQPATKI